MTIRLRASMNDSARGDVEWHLASAIIIIWRMGLAALWKVGQVQIALQYAGLPSYDVSSTVYPARELEQ